MASEWRDVSVEAACSLVVDCPHSTPKWTDSGVVVIRNTYLKAGRMELSNLSFTDEGTYLERVRRAVPQPGDLVISREAPIGEIAMIPEGLRACLGQRVVLLRANANVCDARFLLYSFIGGELRDEILSHDGTGSTVSNLRIPSLKAAKVKLPPLPIQRQIAAILSAFDDKIELNRQMNRTLEQMARALFKSWFVDFDPVRAKMRGEVPEGMDAETAALFPDELVEVEGREMPRGWTWQPLNTIATVEKGLSYKSKDILDSGGVPLIGLKCFNRGGGFREDGIKFYNGEYQSKHVVGAGDLIVAMTDLTQKAEVIGRSALILDSALYGKMIASLDTAIIHPSRYVSRTFLHLSIGSEDSRNELLSHVNGSTVLHLSIKGLREINILIADSPILNSFEKLAHPIFMEMAALSTEARDLTLTRDALLPRLLSGEVDVGEWEAQGIGRDPVRGGLDAQ